MTKSSVKQFGCECEQKIQNNNNKNTHYLCLAFFAPELIEVSPGGFYNCLSYILGLLLNFVFIFNSLLHAEYILCMIWNTVPNFFFFSNE